MKEGHKNHETVQTFVCQQTFDNRVDLVTSQLDMWLTRVGRVLS